MMPLAWTIAGAITVLWGIPSPNATTAPTSTRSSHVTTSAPATTRAQDPLSMGRELASVGRYAQALAAYGRVGRSDSRKHAAAVIGAADVLALTGETANALSRLASVRDAGKNVAAWHLMRARLLEDTGQYDEAIQACQSAMAVDLESFEARCRCARLLDMTGRRQHALRLYEFFERVAHQRIPDRADEMVWQGRGFYRSSVLRRHPGLARRTRYVLHELFQPACETKDPRYWPARIASARLLMSKYNLAEASEDFKAALKINPNLPVAHAGLARAALEKWRFEDCEKQARAALKINPNHVPSRNVLARLRLTERKYRRAADQADLALKTNPNDLEALSLAAAARVRLGDDQAADDYEQRALKINPRCAVLHYTIAEWLSAARQFPEAEKRYLKAAESDPIWADPSTNLGLMYMQWGQEAKARKTLDEAWELDRFNRKTYNVLRLLEQIEKFRRIETEHFILKFDASKDAVLAEYFTEYLESILPGLCRDYGFAPTDKIIVEVFPSHRSFSVRITSRPWIHTIGACTGRVIAMDAPRHGAAMTGPFDWAKVLRHELTHTVTLGVTGNRIPHWFTEALAVRQEMSRLSFDWMWMLSSALRRDRLFPLDAIDWSFIRPKRRGDREQAYAQSRWMADFIVAEYGYDAIGKMLSMFNDRKTQPEVIRAVFSIGTDEFDKRFVAWATRQVKTWGLPVEPIPSVKELGARVKQSPNDARALAALAERHLHDGDIKKASRLAKQAIEQDKENVRGLEVRLTALMETWRRTHGREAREKLADQARPLLERLARLDEGSLSAPRYLAQLAMGSEDLDEAEPWLKRLRRVSPHDPVAGKGLAVLYLQRGQRDKAIAELTPLAEDNQHDPELPLKIARLHRQSGKHAEAARWLMRAVRIDPYDVETHEQLAGLSVKLGRSDEALREYRSLCELEPTNAQHFARLAILHKKRGHLDKARQAARRAVELDPASSVGRLLDDR